MPDQKSGRQTRSGDAGGHGLAGEDMDKKKGAVESQAPGEKDNMSATGQLGHRD